MPRSAAEETAHSLSSRKNQELHARHGCLGSSTLAYPSLLLHDLYYQVEEDVQSIPDDGDDHEEQQVQATPLSKFKE